MKLCFLFAFQENYHISIRLIGTLIIGKLLGISKIRADSISPGITFLQTSISQDVLFRQTTKGKSKSGEIEHLEKWNISSEIE